MPKAKQTNKTIPTQTPTTPSATSSAPTEEPAAPNQSPVWQHFQNTYMELEGTQPDPHKDSKLFLWFTIGIATQLVTDCYPKPTKTQAETTTDNTADKSLPPLLRDSKAALARAKAASTRKPK